MREHVDFNQVSSYSQSMRNQNEKTMAAKLYVIEHNDDYQFNEVMITLCEGKGIKVPKNVSLKEAASYILESYGVHGGNALKLQVPMRLLDDNNATIKFFKKFSDEWKVSMVVFGFLTKCTKQFYS